MFTILYENIQNYRNHCIRFIRNFESMEAKARIIIHVTKTITQT